jgi:GTP-binding protein EngB required for normal cell division
MFQLQQAIEQAYPTLLSWWQVYALPLDQLNQLQTNSQHFIMRVPLVGSFSAGKSTLLNTLLGEKLLAVDIDPVSALAVEFSYATQERIIGHLPNGQTRALSKEELKVQDFGNLVPNGWVNVELNKDVLQPLHHLCLVDLPGLDSTDTQHEQAINSYLHRSLAYCLVISAEAGTLPESTRQFLSELKLHRAPVLVVVTKADKKTADDLSAVIEHIRAQVEGLVGATAIVDVVAVSRKDVSALVPALQQLEGLSEQRLRDTVGGQALNCLSQLEHSLQQLLNTDDLNVEQLKAQIDAHQHEMLQYQHSIERETVELKQKISGIASSITKRAESDLKGAMDSLANYIVNGSDMSSTVSHMIRQAIIGGLQTEFVPLVQQYQERLKDAAPEDIFIPNHFEFNQPTESLDTSALIGTVSTAVAFLLKRFPIAAVLLPIAQTILSHFFSQQREADLREQKHEQARQHVLRVIENQLIPKTTEMVNRCLQEQVQSVQQMIEQQADQQQQIYMTNMQRLQNELMQGERIVEQRKAQYQQDLDAVLQYQQQWAAL